MVFMPVFGAPDIYENPAAVVTADAGIYTIDGGSEVVTGIWEFDVGSISEITTTAAPPSARIVYGWDILPTATHTLQVNRVADGVTYTVRGASNAFAAGGAVIEDWEIPVGVLVTYQATAFDESGASLGSVEEFTATVSCPPSLAWISDPVNPNSVVQVQARRDFGDTLTNVRQVQTYQVGDRVVALLGAMGKLSNLNLHVQTKTLADADMLKTILMQTSVLIRTTPPTRVPRLLYVVVPQVNEVDNDVQWGGGWVEWPLTGTEVSPTTLDILIPVTTWQDYIDAFPTWQDMIDAYDTWFDAMKTPPGGS